LGPLPGDVFFLKIHDPVRLSLNDLMNFDDLFPFSPVGDGFDKSLFFLAWLETNPAFFTLIQSTARIQIHVEV